MNVLIGCERSGVIRRAFRERGHNAYSCDLEPADDGSEFHLQGDVTYAIDPNNNGFYFRRLKGHTIWDLAIFHPPCTFLALCQAWRRKPSKAQCKEFNLDRNDITWRLQEREKAVEFAKTLWESKIERICLEQPKSILTTRMAPKSQTIHPWQFGHPEQKTTWLWLKNLEPLIPTRIVYDEMMLLPKNERERVFHMSPGDDRSDERSVTYEGVARAMADQWGGS